MHLDEGDVRAVLRWDRLEDLATARLVYDATRARRSREESGG
jgi:hypothetical protein